MAERAQPGAGGPLHSSPVLQEHPVAGADPPRDLDIVGEAYGPRRQHQSREGRVPREAYSPVNDEHPLSLAPGHFQRPTDNDDRKVGSAASGGIQRRAPAARRSCRTTAAQMDARTAARDAERDVRQFLKILEGKGTQVQGRRIQVDRQALPPGRLQHRNRGHPRPTLRHPALREERIRQRQVWCALRSAPDQRSSRDAVARYQGRIRDRGMGPERDRAR